LYSRESPRARKSFARPSYLPRPIVSGNVTPERAQRVSDRTIELVSSQRIRRMPRQCENDLNVMNVGRIHDDEIAKASSILRSARTLRKNQSPVPVTILMLAQVHEWMLDVDMTEQNATIEYVASVIPYVNRPARDENRIFVIADVHRVDRHAIEKSAGDFPDVNLSSDLPVDPCLDVASDLVFPVLRLRQRQSDQKYDHHRCQKRECAPCDYSLTP